MVEHIYLDFSWKKIKIITLIIENQEIGYPIDKNC